MLKFLSRKFLLVLIVITIFTIAFFMTDKMNSENFVWGMCGVVASYITGNAIVNFSKKE